MPSEDPVEDLLDRWNAVLEANARADLNAFIQAEGSQLDGPQRADFLARAKRLVAVNRLFDHAFDVLNGPASVEAMSGPSLSPPSDFAAGMEPVPGHKLLSRLGQGGFGQVWRAEGPGGMPVALKIISRGRETQHVELEALEIIKGVRHPHLLSVTAYWQLSDTLIIASELADGTLQDRLNEARQEGLRGIPAAELLGYMKEAAEALDFLNSPQGDRPAIQHGDIKPQNLLRSGQSVKVGDFGLVRPLQGSEAQHGGAMSPPYAAPEFDDGKISGASDQFSLAVTYCYLKTGQLPYRGTAFEIRDAIRKGRPDLSGVTPAERRVVRKALSVSPGRRFPSCTKFVNELAAAQGKTLFGLPTWIRITATAAGLFVIAFIGAGVAWLKDRPRPSATPVTPGPRPPGPAEPSLKRLEEHDGKWKKASDGKSRDVRWVASSLILSAHAGLHGDYATERSFLGQYWSRFMEVADPADALALAERISKVLQAEERFFAEAVDSGDYSAIGDSLAPLAAPLRPHLQWPKFSRLWPFDKSRRMAKLSIDYAPPPMQPMVRAQFEGMAAHEPYDWVDRVLKPRDVFEALHPGLRRYRNEQLYAATELDTVSLLADVTAYCGKIPQPPDHVRRDVERLQSGLLLAADELSETSPTDPSVVPVAEKLMPLLEMLEQNSPDDDDRATARTLRLRFGRIIGTLGSGRDGTGADQAQSSTLLGLPIRTPRLVIVWFEDALPGITAVAKEKHVQQALSDLFLSVGPDVAINLLVAKGPLVPLPEPKPLQWTFDAPMRADKEGRAKLLQALQALDRDAPLPTESCATALERAIDAAGTSSTTIVFIRLRSTLKLDDATVETLSRPLNGLVFHAVAGDRCPQLEALAGAHDGMVVQVRLEGDAVFGDVKTMLLDLPQR